MGCLSEQEGQKNNALLNEVLGLIKGLKTVSFCQSIPFLERLSEFYLLNFPACTLMLTKITSPLIQS